MLSEQENALFTQVGPGTPAGELLRRYWHPIAVAQELSTESPTKFVRVLGEDLVLFLDKSGRVGLLADHCSHRSASLLYGRVEERGIACAYHGWLYDTQGNILETPPERNNAIMKSVKQTAYPVQEFTGMYWAYLGPLPAPAIPRFDVYVRKDGRRTISVYPNLDCNWFVASENAVDPSHLQILHQDMPLSPRRPVNTTRGFIDDIQSSEFYLTPYGIMKKRTYKDGTVDEHPMVFPTDLRTRNSMWVRTPIDDTHTMQWVISFRLTEDGSEVDEERPEVKYLAPLKDPPEAIHPFTKFNMYAPWGQPLSQDIVMWETQGPVADRTKEHLSYSDIGVSMLRRVFKENVERVQQGLDPLGVVRDPNHAMIDTNLERSAKMSYPTGIVAKTVETGGAAGSGGSGSGSELAGT